MIHVLKSRWEPRRDALASLGVETKTRRRIPAVRWLIGQTCRQAASKVELAFRNQIDGDGESLHGSSYTYYTSRESSTIYTRAVTTRGAEQSSWITDRIEEMQIRRRGSWLHYWIVFDGKKRKKKQPWGEIHLLGLQCSLQASAIRTRVGQSS